MNFNLLSRHPVRGAIQISMPTAAHEQAEAIGANQDCDGAPRSHSHWRLKPLDCSIISWARNFVPPQMPS
jgi:hypothetical protein